jgi:hypothetical protein
VGAHVACSPLARDQPDSGIGILVDVATQTSGDDLAAEAARRRREPMLLGPPGTVVELERTNYCALAARDDAPCPSYWVALSEDGGVTWQGRRFVGTLGRAEGKAPPAAVAALVATARQQEWSLERCRVEIIGPSPPTTRVRVMIDGKLHEVHHSPGCPEVFPQWLQDFEEGIERTARIERWTAEPPERSGDAAR